MASAANKYQGQVVHGIEPTAKSNLLKQDEALEELVRVATKGDFFHPLFSTRTFLGPRKVSTPAQGEHPRKFSWTVGNYITAVIL